MPAPCLTLIPKAGESFTLVSLTIAVTNANEGGQTHMATRKSSGGAKRGGAKKGSAKKGGTKKGGAGRGGGKKSVAATTKKGGGAKKSVKAAVQGNCFGWEAIHDFMPPGTPTLTVTGRCRFRTSGFKVRLVEAVPQGINPRILLLRKIVTPPRGGAADVITTVDVKFTKKTKTKYTSVTILPEVVTVKVQVVS